MHLNSVFAYIGPETILPATSALAAIGGVLLAFGHTATRPFVAAYAWAFGKKKNSEAAPPEQEGQPVAAGDVPER